ncbi:methyltransferase domain-containing protein [Archangium violaceum]|uniref:methyltransferase domain-containing protein n=1 Tax=Archangium violaceum TaxID=83451 RepID=UPI0037C1686B
MSDIVGNMTRRLLADAGISAGMRVLDVGCGRGDVTLMLAELVGERGQVVGVDRDVRPLAAARERVRALGLTHITFAEGDMSALSSEYELFDAAVGRRVLMYQPEPVNAVAQLARAVRPGGLVVFQEHDSTRVPVPGGQAPLPLHERVHGWMWQMVKREGADVHMGFHLSAVLARAGLAVEQVRAEAIVQTPTQNYGIAAIVRAILPRIVEQGVATEAEIDIDTLERRLLEEQQKAGVTQIWELVFGAWARKPA